MVGSEDTGTVDDANGNNTSPFGPCSVQCSICLDLVTQNGLRSRAKLICGHEFHLDCIGSAFNTKGAMQCPNCRKVERGRWLYANSSSDSFSHISMVDWSFGDYDLGYSRMPFRVHWCPFNRLTRGQASSEGVESPSTTYNDLQGHHPIFPEHTSGPHSYLAYIGPISLDATNPNEDVDDPNHGNRWNGLSRHNEIVAPHTFPANDNPYQSGARPFSVNGSHITSADQALAPPTTTLRPSRGETEAVTRSGPFSHPFLYGHGHVPRGGSSLFSPNVHPGNHRGSHERIRGSHTIRHQQQPGNPSGIICPVIPGTTRFNGSRGFPPAIPVPSRTDHNGGFFVLPPSSSSTRNLHESENPSLNHFQQWERDRLSHFLDVSPQRDSGSGSFHLHHQDQPTGGSDSSNRTVGFWPRH